MDVSRSQRLWLALVIAALLPLCVFSLYMFWCWVRIHTSDVYYHKFSYLQFAGVGALLASLGILCAGIAFRLAGPFRLLYAMSLFIAVFSCWNIPDFLQGELGLARFPNVLLVDHGQPYIREDWFMSSLGVALQRWHDTHDVYPATDDDFHEAMKTTQGPSASFDLLERKSQYEQRGNQLSYEVVVQSNQSGPQLREIKGRPAVVYYNVTRDQQTYWITLSVLENSVGRSVTLVRENDLPDGRVHTVVLSGPDPAPQQ